MIRIAHLSDLHLTDGPRLEDEARVLREVVDEAIADDVGLWLITGDLYGHTVPHRSTPRERLALFPQVARMLDQAPVVVVQGNHDHTDDLLGLGALAGLHPIHVAVRAGEIVVQSQGRPVRVLALPYPTKGWLLAGESPASVEEGDALVAAKLETLFRLWGYRVRSDDVPTVLAAHVMVRGSTTGSGVVLAGNEIEVTAEALGELRGIRYGALGHMHARQEVRPGVWYPGSLWNTSHSSRPSPTRGWHLVDLSTGAVDFRRTSCRNFVTVSATWSGGTWLIEGGLRDEIRAAEVRVVMEVPQPDMETADRAGLLREVRAMNPHRVVHEVRPIAVHRVRAPEVTTATTLAEKVTAYWDATGDKPSPEAQLEALGALDLLQDLDDDALEHHIDSL